MARAYKQGFNDSDTVTAMYEIVIPGDIDGDGFADLGDAVLGLQIIAGAEPEWDVIIDDVNGDGRIGLEEVIYIFQWIAGD